MVKGIIIMYHGFSACPDAMVPMAEQLAEQGFVSLVPLLVGHGVHNGYDCETKGICDGNGTSYSSLPRTRHGYQRWVIWSLRMLKEQEQLIPAHLKSPDFYIGSLGLSAGGSLSLFALSLPNCPITRALMINPFFAFTSPKTEFEFSQCLLAKDPRKCAVNSAVPGLEDDGVVDPNAGFLQRYFGWLPDIPKHLKRFAAEHFFGRIMNDFDGTMMTFWSLARSMSESPNFFGKIFVERSFGWGPSCVILAESRSGYCTFRIANLFALQTFSEFAVSRIQRVPAGITVAIVQSDKDGPVRASLNAAVLAQLTLQDVQVSECHYAMICSWDNIYPEDNSCGAPHSMLSHDENIVKSPFALYWEADVFLRARRFFGGSDGFPLAASSKTIDISKCNGSRRPLLLGEAYQYIGPRYVKSAIENFRGSV